MWLSERVPFTVVLIAIWVLPVGVGMLILVHYETAPGPSSASAERWPTDSKLLLDRDRPTLVMLTHPRCPCSRASIEELAALLARCQGRVTAHVLFFVPARESEDWARTDLWHSATAIPGVQVSSDTDGDEAKRFGAGISGHVVMYAPDGRRLYSGGITGSRGHAGDNAGRAALLALVNEVRPETAELPVFGCTTFEPSRCSLNDTSCQAKGKP